MSRSHPTSREMAFSLALALVALLPRLFVSIAWPQEPVWDGHYYHFGASRIAAGLGYSEDVLIRGVLTSKPWCHYPVGYSAFLAPLYAVFGAGNLVAPITNALIGTAIVVLVHRLALSYVGELRARIAGGVAALHPGLIAYSAVVMNELLTALLLLLALYLPLVYRERLRGTVLGAVCLGLCVLVRPTVLLAAPLLALAARVDLRGRLLRAVIATLIALGVALPWTLRNCSVMDGCAFVATNGGWNLAIGALTETGRFTTLRAKDGCPVVTGQVQQDRCWAAVGRRVIAEDPLRWLLLMPKKLSHTYDHESFAVEYLREANPRDWPEPRRVAGRQLMTLAHRLLLVAAALSAIAWPWSRGRLHGAQLVALAALSAFVLYAAVSNQTPFYWLPTVLPLLALLPLPGRPAQGAVGGYALGLLLLTTLTHAIFFGDDRYHLVVTPALCLLAGAALRPPSTDKTAAPA